MIKTFTHNDVIRYIYQETSVEESLEIEKALICDAELQHIHAQFSVTKHQLDKVRKKPSDIVVQNILNYSKSLNLHSVN